ncbi:MAG: hypothetical protein HUJ51_02760, partial [Eggerthellaceae bacterium]|nr:hypothetical protein [Eggerthellaceae bacterium]
MGFILFLLGAMFVIPRGRFENRAHYRRFIFSVFVFGLFVLVTFALPFVLSSGAIAGDARQGSAINGAQQLAYIFSNPLAYAKTLYHFLMDYFELSKMSMFFNSFGYLGTMGFIGRFAVIPLLFVALTDTNKRSLQLVRPFNNLFVLLIFAVLM